MVAACILMVSLFGVALAEGGDTHGPPAMPPAVPECTADCPSTEASTTAQPTQDSVDITTAEMLAAWLATSIL